MDGQKEARKRETAHAQMEKGDKDKHLKLLNLQLIPFYLKKL